MTLLFWLLEPGVVLKLLLVACDALIVVRSFNFMKGVPVVKVLEHETFSSKLNFSLLQRAQLGLMLQSEVDVSCSG
jgi:hypothetical protein